MSELITGQKRTKRCAEFSKTDIGSKVTAMGWVSARRDMGKIIFEYIFICNTSYFISCIS